jgi:hypothetical protein
MLHAFKSSIIPSLFSHALHNPEANFRCTQPRAAYRQPLLDRISSLRKRGVPAHRSPVEDNEERPKRT